jgi:hypothetical protein
MNAFRCLIQHPSGLNGWVARSKHWHLLLLHLAGHAAEKYACQEPTLLIQPPQTTTKTIIKTYCLVLRVFQRAIMKQIRQIKGSWKYFISHFWCRKNTCESEQCKKKMGALIKRRLEKNVCLILESDLKGHKIAHQTRIHE